MKPTALILVVFLTLCACSKENKEKCNPPSIDRAVLTFKQMYLNFFQSDAHFLLKGVIAEVYKQGCDIEVLEDLKGNFIDESHIFVRSAKYYYCDNEIIELPHTNYFSLYHKNDTLIVFVEKDHQKSGYMINADECYSPALKLSNGYVCGVNPPLEEATPWKDLQEELQAFSHLRSEEQLFWHSKGFIPNAFNAGYKTMSLLFIDRIFIQGLVVESYGGYGKKIQLIADLKGNFPEKISTFIAWGDSGSTFKTDRIDDLREYNNQDTLLMLLHPMWAGEEEKKGDYVTFPYTYSILKLSNNLVSGHITSCYDGEECMPWGEFELLLTQLTKQYHENSHYFLCDCRDDRSTACQ